MKTSTRLTFAAVLLVVASCDGTAVATSGGPSLASETNSSLAAAAGSVAESDLASSRSPQQPASVDAEEPEFVLSENVRELFGTPYGEARRWLIENGWTRDTQTESWHTVADDPADCGNRGCTVFWRDSHGARACVGVHYDERLEEKDREVTDIGACD